MKIDYRKALVSGFVTLVWINIQVIPANWAPVIPDPVYKTTFISVWRILRIVFYPMPGIQYQFNIYSILGFALLIGTGFFLRKKLRPVVGVLHF